MTWPTITFGLGECPVSAAAVPFTDEKVAGLRFAQSRGVPHISISRDINELAPEVAAYVHAPSAAPVVLGIEWLGRGYQLDWQVP